MVKLNHYTQLGYAAILLLLLASLFGPWGFTPDGVPPVEYCDQRFILIQGPHCVRTLPMTEIFSMFMMSFLSMLTAGAALKISWAEVPRMFLAYLSLICILLPHMSTLLLIVLGRRPKLRLFHLAAYFIGAGLGILVFIVIGFDSITWDKARLWGVLLYLALTAGMLVDTLLGWRTKKRLDAPQIANIPR